VDGDIVATITQGTSLVSRSYTARVHRQRDDLVVYSLDERFPHWLDGATGFARVSPNPNGGTRLTFFIALGFGGTIRFLFGSKIERDALATADRVRDEAERRARAKAVVP
jgi:hypothetical protein